MNEFQELEFKYKANEVKFVDFEKLVNSLNLTKSLDISSWDHYFVKNEEEFLRFRNGSTPELTKKKKIKDTNNWIRVECDLPLDPKRITQGIVNQFADMEGYKLNFKIYKSCFIKWTPEVNYVYYLVFDENLKEIGRFIETEINKEKIPELIKEGKNPEEILRKSEELLLGLGISPQNRMRKSLFELYKK